MLITSHSSKWILKPSWTILVNSFNFSCTGEGGGQQCHRRAGAPPCLISTLPFFFGSKITEPRALFVAFTGLQCPVPSLQLTIRLPLAPWWISPWWQHPQDVQRQRLWNEAAGLKEVGGHQNGGPMGALKHAVFWETEEGIRNVRVIKGESGGNRGRRSQNSHK